MAQALFGAPTVDVEFDKLGRDRNNKKVLQTPNWSDSRQVAQFYVTWLYRNDCGTLAWFEDWREERDPHDISVAWEAKGVASIVGEVPLDEVALGEWVAATVVKAQAVDLFASRIDAHDCILKPMAEAAGLDVNVDWADGGGDNFDSAVDELLWGEAGV